jgi:hypothetical protein
MADSTPSMDAGNARITIERTYDASAEDVGSLDDQAGHRVLVGSRRLHGGGPKAGPQARW